jgi:hypothetical protein
MQQSSSPPRPTLLPNPSLRRPPPSVWKALQPPPTQIVHEKPNADAPPSEQLKYLMQQIDVQKQEMDVQKQEIELLKDQKQEIELLKDQNEYQASQIEYQASQIEVVNWDIKDIHKKFNMRAKS